jgi:oligopeptide transport system permease protein
LARTEDAPAQKLLAGRVASGLGSPAAAEVADRGDTGPASTTQVSSPFRDSLRRFLRNWAALASLALIGIMFIMSVFAPFMHTMNPNAQNYSQLYFGPSPSHWFGTDGVGHDIYSRVVYGLRVNFAVGGIGTLVTVALGVGIGVVSGYYPGVIDSVLARLMDIFFAFPSFLLALLAVGLFGANFDPMLAGNGRVILLTIVFSVVSWPFLARFVRGLTLTLRDQQYVDAARTAGSSDIKIIGRHLLPNMVGLILVQAALTTIGIIYNQVALSIFGLGIPNNPDLGQMLYDGAEQLDPGVAAGYFCLAIFPAITLALLLVGLTFIGDGVRDAVDTRMT